MVQRSRKLPDISRESPADRVWDYGSNEQAWTRTSSLPPSLPKGTQWPSPSLTPPIVSGTRFACPPRSEQRVPRHSLIQTHSFFGLSSRNQPLHSGLNIEYLAEWRTNNRTTILSTALVLLRISLRPRLIPKDIMTTLFPVVANSTHNTSNSNITGINKTMMLNPTGMPNHIKAVMRVLKHTSTPSTML